MPARNALYGSAIVVAYLDATGETVDPAYGALTDTAQDIYAGRTDGSAHSFAVPASGKLEETSRSEGQRCGVPTVDKGSLAAQYNGGQGNADRVAGVLAAATELQHPISLISLQDVNLDEYAAVYYPGGHGPMEDLAVDADSGKLLTLALESGKPLGVVCHGPAALLAAEQDGVHAFAGYRVAAFTNDEETRSGFADKAKWLLQDRLTEGGVQVLVGEPWAPYSVVDRDLVTGQNPASSAPLAAELLKTPG